MTGIRQRAWRLALAVRRWRDSGGRRRTPAVDVLGIPSWAAQLFEPQFPLRSGRIDVTGLPPDHVVLRCRDVCVPFIQPLTMNPSSRPKRSERALPPEFNVLASAARRATPERRPTRLRSSSARAWLASTACAQPAYRRAHHRTSSHAINAVLASQGRPRLEVELEVAIICASNRPGQLENVIANYQRQRYERRRLVLVTNSSEFDLAEVRRRLVGVERAQVFAVDEKESLGTCLNVGMDQVGSRFIAKFDDDDRYGPDYLTDMMIAHRFAEAGVVGKHSHLAQFSVDGRLYVRFPGREFECTSWVAGGTLVIDRERTGDIRFDDRSLGEDGAFLADCQRAGHSVYAADRFHYVQRRTGANTWPQDRDRYLRDAIEIDPGAVHLIEP